MKLKSNNVYYMVGIIPLLSIVSILALIVLSTRPWIFYPLLMVATLTIYQLIKKFIFMPRPVNEYRNLKKINLNLPINYEVDYFTSKDLDKYSFLVRLVEVLSPLYLKKNEKLRVVISEKLLNSRSETFIQMSVCRELEKYRTKSQVKVTLTLVVPILVTVGFILWGRLTNLHLLDYFSHFTTYFLLPFLFVIIFLTFLFTWNQYLSQQETKLDRILTSYFDIDDVETYINEIEAIEGSVEKTKYKDLNHYYAKQRVKKLKNLN